MNAVRTEPLLRRADVVVVRFGEKYKQWNAAFDAGYAAALGKPLIAPREGGPREIVVAGETRAAADVEMTTCIQRLRTFCREPVTHQRSLACG